MKKRLKIISAFICIIVVFVPCILLYEHYKYSVLKIIWVPIFLLVHGKIYRFLATVFILSRGNPPNLEGIITSGQFVLYLRPFSIDSSTKEYINISLSNPAAIFRTKVYTIQEQITNTFYQAGMHVVSLTDPATKSINLGTEQLSLGPHSDWKATIRDWMEKSCMIIINVASVNQCDTSTISQGLAWELRQCFKDEAIMQKTLLIFPGKPEEQALLGNIFNAMDLTYALPEKLPLNKKAYGGLVYYRDGTPKKFKFEGTWLLNESRMYIWAGMQSFLVSEEIVTCNYRVAPLYKGMIANCIDVAFIVIIIFILDKLHVATDDFFMFFLIILFGYFFSLSIGKRIMRITVRDKSGIPPQGNQRFARQMLKPLLLILFPIILLLRKFNPGWKLYSVWLHNVFTKTDKFEVLSQKRH